MQAYFICLLMKYLLFCYVIRIKLEELSLPFEYQMLRYNT